MDRTLEVGMLRRREEAAVVGVHAKRRLALVDDAKESAKVAVQAIRALAVGHARLPLSRHLATKVHEALRLVVRIVDREQGARLCVEAEQHPIEEDERVLKRRRQISPPTAPRAEQPGRQERDGLENLALQRVTNGHGAALRLAEHPIEQARPRSSGSRAIGRKNAANRRNSSASPRSTKPTRSTP